MESTYELDSCLWELTLKCNMNCLHCGSVAGRAREEELTLDESFDVANELVKLGCKELTLIGGEVFLYKGWQELARYLSDNGVLVNIMTNGYRISEKELGQIIYAKLTNVGVSIDGMEENHNRIRGKRDSFSRIKKTFDLLNREQVPIGAVTALLNFNVSDLEDLYVFLTGNNVTIWQIQLVNPMGNMSNKKYFIVNPDKIPLITEFIKEKNKDKGTVVLAADSIGYYDDNEIYIRGIRTPVSYWEGCQAGISSIFIDSVGNVKGCGALYSDLFIEGNIRDKSLKAIWEGKENFSYNRKFDIRFLTGRCESCDVGDICKGGCRASNYFTNNYLYENAFCCHKRQDANV